MQIKKYTGDNGGVIHGITGNFKGKTSCFLDRTGKMIDAEQILPSGAVKAVRKNLPTWEEIKTKSETYWNQNFCF
jgi:hypothetical protein